MNKCAIVLLFTAISLSAQYLPVTKGPHDDMKAAGNWPSAITCKTMTQNRYEYTIKSHLIRPDDKYLIWESKDGKPDKGYRDFPNCIKITADRDKETITVITYGPVKDLEECINKFARASGYIPYWEAMLLADKRSPKFDPYFYMLVYKQELTPAMLPEQLRLKLADDYRSYRSLGVSYITEVEIDDGGKYFQFKGVRNRDKTNYIYRLNLLHTEEYGFNAVIADEVKLDNGEERELNEEDTVDLQVGNNKYQVTCTPYTAHCMGQSVHALRIMGDGNYVLWEDTKTLVSYASLFTNDINNDGNDEIVVFINDHGIDSLYIYTKKPISITPYLRKALSQPLDYQNATKEHRYISNRNELLDTLTSVDCIVKSIDIQPLDHFKTTRIKATANLEIADDWLKLKLDIKRIRFHYDREQPEIPIAIGKTIRLYFINPYEFCAAKVLEDTPP